MAFTIVHLLYPSQIGQFGVGFYSVYLVADKVTVRSKHADDEQHVWESAADGTFSIWADDEGEDLGRGTEIKLHLKDDAKEFTDQKKLEKLIRRYSEFINFPIYLRKERQETREVADEDATETEDEDEVQVEDEEEEKEKKTETVTVHEWVLINDQPAIWTRSKNDITEEEYKNFYKSITKDSEDPLTWIHFKAEGEIEFRSILYVPNTAPPGLYEDYYGKSTSLRLYVRKVLISDEFEDIMPRYLNFIKGMVDSDDLPLNVSRETLQQNRVIKAIKKKLVRKALEMLRKLAEEDEDDEEEEDKEEGEEEEEKEEKKSGRYIRFWKQFGKSIKLGLLEDTGNKSKLAKLLRYKSTKTVQEDDDVYTSLDKYVKNMKPWQNEIYYIAGESIEAVQNSPFLERFRAKDVEVLYMIDPLDEYALQQLQDYEGHKLQSVTKEGLKFGDEEKKDKKRLEKYKESFEPLTDYLKDVLSDDVEKVTVTNRLAETPAILVTSQYGYSANMQRILKSQTLSDPERARMMMGKKILEVNPRHPIVTQLKNKVEEGSDDEETKDLANVLYDTALLNSGFDMEKPENFASRMYRLMQNL